MITIFEMLQAAKSNLTMNRGKDLDELGKDTGINQVVTAVTLLEKGYGLNEDVSVIMQGYENVKDVPDKSELQFTNSTTMTIKFRKKVLVFFSIHKYWKGVYLHFPKKTARIYFDRHWNLKTDSH